MHLARSGNQVAVNYLHREEAAAEAVRSIRSEGGTALAVQGDVGSASDVDAMIARIADEMGPVEILVNNAGIRHDDLLLRMSPEAWAEVITTNLTSAYLCTRAVLRGMLRSKWGRIITIGSVAGLAGNPGQTNYAAAKAGVIGFTKSLAKEVGSRGITVNVVAPGFIETELTSDLGDELRSKAANAIALGRFGTPQEVAAAVGYLSSDDASYITGQVLVVDGGLAL